MDKLLLAVLLSLTTPVAEAEDLINGTPANPEEFGAVLIRTEKAACTATVVGERSVLFAAHCAAAGSQAVFALRGVPYSCIVSTGQNDMALCLTDRIVEGILYETVNLDPTFVALGDQLLLTGFGCIYPGGSGGNDGVYRIGMSYVQTLATEYQTNYVTSGGGALCFGDSGGPAFKYTATSRRVVAVNSMADLQSVSYITSTSLRMSQDFFLRWTTATGSPICGFSPEATHCR